MSDNSRAAFEEAYEKFRREHVNASFMPKDMALAIWQACEKRLLLSKVQLLSDDSINEFISAASNPDLLRSAIHWYRDNIKLVPLTIEDDIRDTLISIIDNVRSCHAGDGDDRTWKECALNSETLASDLLHRLLDMSQKDEKNDTSKERVDSNDISEQAFEEAYNEFRRKHINASFMPKDMAKFMWLAGRDSVTTDKMIQNPTNVSNKQRLGEYRAGHYSSEMIAAMVNEAFLRVRASREFKLPSEKIEYWIDNTNRLPNYNLNAMFHYVHEMVKFLNEIKALNEGEGEK